VRGRHFTLWLTAAVALLTSLASAAFAEPLRYRVREGDTLPSLGARYFLNNDYRAVLRYNRIANPAQLTVGSTLLIPEEILRTEPIAAQVSSFRGNVQINGKQVEVGSRVAENARVETGANAFLTISMPDGSSISLPSQSRIIVVHMRRILLTGMLDRDFRLEAGRSRSSVTPMTDPDSRFRVTTPLSVAAVRGTDFRVGVDPAGRSLTEVVGGTVAVKGTVDPNEVPVPRGFGSITTASGTEPPIALLPPPTLDTVGRTPTGVLITIKPVDGAQRYKTQLASDIGFLQVFDETVTDEPSVNFNLSAGTTFFIRLTAIAPNGLEGMPATYALSQRVADSGQWRSVEGEERHGAATPAKDLPVNMSGHGRTQSPSRTATTPLR
jgi:hypothetical protein